MRGEFEGARVVVTGAASGIGAAVAAAFARQGADLVLLDRDDNGVERVAEGLRGTSRATISTVAVDLGDEASVVRAVRSIADGDAPRVLVNQAGVIARMPFFDMSLDDWQAVQRINVGSMFLLCREIVPLMLEAGGGAIVNCASGAAFASGKGLAAYTASKGAVLAFTRSLAIDHAPLIRANAVCPGLIDTPGAWAGLDELGRQARARHADRVPAGRLGTGADVAEAVLFLASERASYCTGTSLVVDGGALASAS